MKRILVLTDFSKCANNASLYAIHMANEYGLELIFYHSTYQYLKNASEDIKNNLIEHTNKNLQEVLTNNIHNIYNSLKLTPGKINYIVNYATHLVERIEEIIQKEKIDFIIMGTKGATGMDRILFGSNAVKIIDHVSCPVLSIPQTKKFKPFKKILLFSELNDLENELKDIIPIAKKVNCLLEVCNLNDTGNSIHTEVMKIINQQKENSSYSAIKFSSIQRMYNKDLVTQIEMITSKAKPDIICLHTLKYNWFEKLFTYSYTKELVYHTKSAILTFSKRKHPFYLPTL